MTLDTPPSAPSAPAPDELVHRYRSVRAATEALSAPLSPEDQVVQSMPDVSPTKWHRAHTTWFFETFLLPALPGYEAFDPEYCYLFNSYYEAVGERHPRPERGLVARPGVTEVADYRRHVDEAMERLLAGRLDAAQDDLLVLGLHHEQQHQELLLMDIKHVLFQSRVRPAYHRPEPTTPVPVRALGWHLVAGGIHEAGHEGGEFAFDNETPRHEVLLADYELADRLVTAGEWLEFITDGGYADPALWLSDGWSQVQQAGWSAPLYWYVDDDGCWWHHTLAGRRAIDPGEPVVHVSYYEADAFARWAGARLPTEFEWEVAAADLDPRGNFADAGRLHPMPAPALPGLTQMFGDVWEWTASAYLPYPGFEAAAGAVGEYNGKFMVNQHVLRGGSAVTPAGHLRATYRNFFPPEARWAFSGVRLARS